MTLLNFIENLKQSAGCIEWPGYRDTRGYGRLTLYGAPGFLAHRAAYEVHNGSIPEDMTVDHLCFNPGCVNPSHMQLLSRSDNSQRQRSAEFTHCKSGHEFTVENTYIRPDSQNGRRTCRACQRQSVARYKRRRTAA